MTALDTNIWLYSHDSRDPVKQQRAQRIIAETNPIALLWQVGCEFVAAGRKLQPFGFTHDQAWNALREMRQLSSAILLPTPETWDIAEELHRQYSLSFWDGMIVAACLQHGIGTLVSEDINPAASIDGLMILNPFPQG